MLYTHTSARRQTCVGSKSLGFRKINSHERSTRREACGAWGCPFMLSVVFVLLHARISRTRVCQCVWNMRWRARRAYIAPDIAH